MPGRGVPKFRLLFRSSYVMEGNSLPGFPATSGIRVGLGWFVNVALGVGRLLLKAETVWCDGFLSSFSAI